MFENENLEIFARSPKSSEIAPFELNNEGGNGYALVLRYAGCNLRCPLCYAWRYAWFPEKEGYKYKKIDVLKVLEKLYSIDIQKKINWIRIQGGEPCLNVNRILFTLEICYKALKIIYDTGLNKYKTTRAIIQTNGISFSQLDDKHILIIRKILENVLRNIDNGRIIIEFSFKDPTSKRRLNNKSLLEIQIKGFKTLLDKIVKPLWDNEFENIAVYLVGGLGPSLDFHNSSIVPIDPYSLPNEYPLFHPKTWSNEFRSLYIQFIENIVTYTAYKDYRNNEITKQGRKIPLEEFEATWFQTSWISGYAKNYERYGLKIGKDIPLLCNLLRRLDTQLDNKWKGICKNKKEWKEILENIPISCNPDKLKRLILEMNNWFYPSHPKNHYPYL